MKNIILWLVLVILISSCSNINIISDDNNKPNPCYYDKDNGTIKPYDSNKYRVTEKYLWEH